MEYIKSEHYDIVRNDYGREMVIPSEKEWTEVKRGRWVRVEEDDDDIFLAYWCTKCRRTIYVDADGRFVIGLTIRDMHFCPNCGAKMEDEE